jgi:hypothetical protein
VFFCTCVFRKHANVQQIRYRRSPTKMATTRKRQTPSFTTTDKNKLPKLYACVDYVTKDSGIIQETTYDPFRSTVKRSNEGQEWTRILHRARSGEDMSQFDEELRTRWIKGYAARSMKMNHFSYVIICVCVSLRSGALPTFGRPQQLKECSRLFGLMHALFDNEALYTDDVRKTVETWIGRFLDEDEEGQLLRELEAQDSIRVENFPRPPKQDEKEPDEPNGSWTQPSLKEEIEKGILEFFSTLEANRLAAEIALRAYPLSTAFDPTRIASQDVMNRMQAMLKRNMLNYSPEDEFMRMLAEMAHEIKSPPWGRKGDQETLSDIVERMWGGERFDGHRIPDKFVDMVNTEHFLWEPLVWVYIDACALSSLSTDWLPAVFIKPSRIAWARDIVFPEEMPKTCFIPPVKVTKLKGSWYLIDTHTRTSINCGASSLTALAMYWFFILRVREGRLHNGIRANNFAKMLSLDTPAT